LQARDALVQVLAEKSQDLVLHVNGVGELAAATATELGLAPDEVAAIRVAAQLHDIGKVAIPESILNKPGALDEPEWRFMKWHTLIGERILAAAPALADVASVVRSSHEQLDGSGYPDGLVKDQIPLGARIVAVGDAFEAMTSDRPYRDALTVDEAIAELRRGSGTQFDPVVVDAFLTVLDGRRETWASAAEPGPAPHGAGTPTSR
jgi:HD-GYP domain-containing protein (c-di-GMP phosphodiesterase class II)